MNISVIKKSCILIFAMVIMTQVFTGCEGSAEMVCHENFVPGVANVAGPTETSVGTPVDLIVSFNVYTSCGKFVKFTEGPMTENTREIAINAEYDGCDCEEKLFVRNATYTFTASQPGTYILKFHKTSLTFITHTIVVN
jgi:hypothetical protein